MLLKAMLYQDNSDIFKLQEGAWEERREFESLGVLKHQHMRKWSTSAEGVSNG